MLLAAIAGCLAFCSCDEQLYEYEEDCTTYYKVKFRYDYNMKFADAFAHEVDCVTLYLLDESGTVVWQKTEDGDTLKHADYAMDVDVPSGRYSLLAWAGTKDKNSWMIPETTVGEELDCFLQTKSTSDGDSYMDQDIDRLFHGWLPNQEFIELTNTGGTITYTVSLVKDTNHFMVILQHIAGDVNMDKDNFDIFITDENSKMNWDNSLLPAIPTTYYSWLKTVASTDMDSGTVTKSTEKGALIAELTMPRLVVGQTPTLTVFNKEENEVTLSIPLLDYVTLVKGYYNREMDDQEYLDRQDEWQLIFFLDDGSRWIDTYIYINSWRVVLQSAEL